MADQLHRNKGPDAAESTSPLIEMGPYTFIDGTACDSLQVSHEPEVNIFVPMRRFNLSQHDPQTLNDSVTAALGRSR